MKIFQANLFRFQADIIPEKGPWAALILIPVTIISGAYWTSIPFYGVIAVLWLFQRKTPIQWEAGLSLKVLLCLEFSLCQKQIMLFGFTLSKS